MSERGKATLIFPSFGEGAIQQSELDNLKRSLKEMLGNNFWRLKIRVNSSNRNSLLFENLEVDFNFNCSEDGLDMMKATICVIQKISRADSRDDSTMAPQMLMEMRIFCDSNWTKDQIFIFEQCLRCETNVLDRKFGKINHWDTGRGEKYLKIFVSFSPSKENFLNTIKECFEQFDLRRNPTNSIRRRGEILPPLETSLDSGSQLISSFSSVEETRASTPNSSHEDANANDGNYEASSSLHVENTIGVSIEDALEEGNLDIEVDNPQNRTIRNSGGAGSSRSSAETVLPQGPDETSIRNGRGLEYVNS